MPDATPPHVTAGSTEPRAAGSAAAHAAGAAAADVAADRGDGPPPDLSVLVPTHRRPRAVERLLTGLARQTPDAGEHEIVLGFDGPDPEGERRARRAWLTAGGRPGRLRIAAGPGRGYIAVRHRLLPTLRGRIVVSLNDDVVPVPGFLAAHRRAHEDLAAAGRQAVVVGDSRFAPVPDPTLLDAALDRTGLVFFWHAMVDERGEPRSRPGRAERDRDWGFRHCFGLNVSVLRSELEAAGGVPSVPETYGYDDVELGWRLSRRGLPVLFRPEAAAPHEHRYRAAGLLQREFRLGRAAVRYATVAPDFARALFGRDLRSEDERAWARGFLARERGDLLARRTRFLALDHLPACDVAAAVLPLTCDLVADLARPLRRACWYEGLLTEAGEVIEPHRAITPRAEAAPMPPPVAASGRGASATPSDALAAVA